MPIHAQEPIPVNRVKVRRMKRATLVTWGKTHLYVSKSAKRFLFRHKKTLLRIKDLILTNQGAEIIPCPVGLAIERKATGNHKGQNNKGTYFVHVGKRVLFIKHFLSNTGVVRLVKRFEKLSHVLDEVGGEIRGVKIRLISPEIIYAKDGEMLLATPFFDDRRVLQTEDFLSPHPAPITSLSIKDALFQLGLLFNEKKASFDSPTINSFYEPAKNTLWLFDF